MNHEKLGVYREFRNPNILFHLAISTQEFPMSFTRSQPFAQPETISAFALSTEGSSGKPNPAPAALRGSRNTPSVLLLPQSTTVSVGIVNDSVTLNREKHLVQLMLTHAAHTLLWQTQNTQYILSFSRISSSVILDFFLCRSVFLYRVFVLEFSGWGVVASLAGAGAAAGSITERV